MNLYYFFVTVSIIVGVNSLTDEQKAKLEKFSDECKTQSGVSQELIDKALNGELEDVPELRQQIFCVAKKIELADDSDGFIVDNLMSQIRKVAESDEEAQKIYDKCVVKEDTQEHTIFYTLKCLHETKPKFSPVQ